MAMSRQIGITLTATKAIPSDLDTVYGIYAEIGAWLHDVKGIKDQWPRAWGRGLLEHLIAAEVLFLFYFGEDPVGTCILSDRQESVWDGSTGDALYLHGLAIRRAMAGRDLGQQILHWAERETARRGCKLLRLDCVASNDALRTYYAACDFTEIKMVEKPESLALFEKRLLFPIT